MLFGFLLHPHPSFESSLANFQILTKDLRNDGGLEVREAPGKGKC